MRIALAALLLLAACQRAPAPDNQALEPAAPAEPAGPANAADGTVAAAQRLVRRRLGTSGDLHFIEARTHASDGVSIVCGTFEQGGVRHRYIIVGAERAFVEPRMRPGEMDRAFREYCGDGERG